MKERPILFSAPMVQAILAGRKTQTRRLVKVQPLGGHPDRWECYHGPDGVSNLWTPVSRAGEIGIFGIGGVRCPYGKPGDRLWVKETHLPKASGIIYRADYHPIDAAGLGGLYGGWKPSIFCRREYSRISLEITAVRIERLNAIDERDAEAEGADREFLVVIARPDGGPDYSIPTSFRGGYANLWDRINGNGSWDANPWVWVVEFKPIVNDRTLATQPAPQDSDSK